MAIVVPLIVLILGMLVIGTSLAAVKLRKAIITGKIYYGPKEGTAECWSASVFSGVAVYR